MSRLAIPAREDAPLKSQALLDAVEKQLGVAAGPSDGTQREGGGWMHYRLGFLFAVCSVAGLMAVAAPGDANAQTTISPFKRTDIGMTNYPDDRHVCIQQLLVAPPNRAFPRLTHPGVEATTVLSGSLFLSVEGQPDRLVKAGESFFIPSNVPHGGRTGPHGTRMVAVFIVEKDKPLVSPAPR